MRSWYCIQRSSRSSRLQFLPREFHNSHCLGVARYASRQSAPGFGGHNPGPRPFKANSPGSESSKSSKNPPNFSEEESIENANKAKIRRSFRIGPGKILIFSIAALISYKIYTWQTNPHRSIILNPKFFTPFILEARDKVSSTSSILTLQSLPKGQNTENVAAAWKAGVWSVQVMQPELQIARAYTPLPPSDDAEPEQLRLFVRKEPQGEVSTFLHKINRGTLVHMRGPHLEYEIPQDVDEVLFIAGGTGIAPALQVAHTLYKYRTASSGDSPKLRILWANRRREDSYKGLEPSLPQQLEEGFVTKLRGLADRLQGKPDPQSKEVVDETPTHEARSQTRLVEEVEGLKSTYVGRVNIVYFVDEESSYITETILRRHLSSSAATEQPSENGGTPKKIILISGPEGFVSFYAGAKSMKAGKEIQGPLGGMLRYIDPKGWEVWKL